MNELGTHRYQTFAPWMGTPISTSVGEYRGMPGLDYVTAFKPIGLVKIEDRDEFTERYFARLDKMASAVVRDLDRLSERYPGSRLVFLCYEDITRPGVWCHREVLSEWLATKGIACPEIPASRMEAIDMGLAEAIEPYRPAPPADLPPSLF